MSIANEGAVDRSIRLIGAALLLSSVFVGAPAGYLGLYPLVTAVFGYDPLYAVLGADTRFSTVVSPEDPTET